MIQILGQILRNGATSIAADDKNNIVREVFRLSRRMLGMAFEDLGNGIQEWRQIARTRITEIANLGQQPLTQDKIAMRADKEIVGICWLACFTVSKAVSEAVGAGLLSRTYERVVNEDPAIANQIFTLSIQMDHDSEFPSKETELIHGKMKGNWFTQYLIRTLVVHHFYLYEVPYNVRQSVCDKLGITQSAKLIAGPERNKKTTGPHYSGKKSGAKRLGHRK